MCTKLVFWKVYAMMHGQKSLLFWKVYAMMHGQKNLLFWKVYAMMHGQKNLLFWKVYAMMHGQKNLFWKVYVMMHGQKIWYFEKSMLWCTVRKTSKKPDELEILKLFAPSCRILHKWKKQHRNLLKNVPIDYNFHNRRSEDNKRKLSKFPTFS